MAELLAALASGTIFGSALTLAGVASPRVIIDQLRLTNFHMLLAFMSASACSAVIVVAANHTGLARLGHRKDSSLGVLGRYDGNIIGGALQGVGMALTGACPGTVLVQAAAGVGRGFWVMLGGLLGGAAFVKWKKKTAARTDAPEGKHTIMQKTGLSASAVVLGYETLLLAVITAANSLAPTGTYFLNPAVGGLLIGAAQAASVLFSKKTLGVSSAYEDAGQMFWALLEGKTPPGWGNVVFAAGVAAGARATMHYVPFTLEAMLPEVPVSILAALIGGFAIIFGGRLAGGCTSGHGISGMATMSFSSFITVASMFAGGIGAALVLS
ncbi:uncharacterized protein HMPREF1541_08776 [Cyphellophora europaea CBS 101466]|uniref:Uncharacterized protein n=1 Tax=Cyphellophora europaea (strain CBS 101466) TaxID=1220924 RepID=W2RLB9_CYPE1|nr:uncharacterized protein HMPREF1541_08776 [Cyphellophora europaea CBS 101466]ETN36498.1 hypothetical protein HMPREF1541_08776 [Cyphellophora europaea CBS 101466]